VARHVGRHAGDLPEAAGRSLSQWDGTKIARHLVREAVVAAISSQTIQRMLAAHRLTP
jgi:hypothetical protein